MRLATRMKITYGVVFFVPIILIAVTFWGLGRLELESLRQKYDMRNASMEMLFNPFEVLGNMSDSVVEELESAAEQKPEQFENIEYLENINARLERVYSFLVVRKDGEIYYSGEDIDFVNRIELGGEIKKGGFIV